MKIHEYQAKEIFKKHNIRVPRGRVAFSLSEAKKIYEEFSFEKCVVKAQIHAGGRGKGGGVKLAKNKEEFEKYASTILGMNLITKQTGPQGKEVKKILIEETCEIAKELYFSMIVDRGSGGIAIIASTEGGMEIEEVAAKSPQKIIKERVEGLEELPAFMARKIAFRLGLTKDQLKDAGQFFVNLFNVFVKYDCSLLELNPLVITKSGELLALDAKVSFDDNALYRHGDLLGFKDLDEEDPKELEASKYDLNYISLDGNIGCLVNGAGLAMATMDIIKLHGGLPANFLDVGGSATQERVTQAFKIILKDKNVRAILVNIFGGIVKCDIIANGVVAAAKELSLSIPLVVRLSGTNCDIGKKILDTSGLNIISAQSMKEAAQKVVTAAKAGR